jgi:hypothetical protein
VMQVIERAEPTAGQLHGQVPRAHRIKCQQQRLVIGDVEVAG